MTENKHKSPEDIQNLENRIYKDAMILRKMSAPIKIKGRMLAHLLSEHPDVWTVVGITREALNVFAGTEFKKKSGMRINRAHIEDRYKIYEVLLTNENLLSDEPTPKKWWEYYKICDLTILSTSAENKQISRSDCFEILKIDHNQGLFKSEGFAWSHRENKEESFLKKLSFEQKPEPLDLKEIRAKLSRLKALYGVAP